MPYSEAARWVVEELARGGGALREFDGKCVVATAGKVIASADTPQGLPLSEDLGMSPDSDVVFLRVILLGVQ